MIIPSAILAFRFCIVCCFAGQQNTAHAAQIQEDIANMIAQIADSMQEVEEQERSALSQMDQVEAETSISMDDEQSLPPIEEAREPRYLASQKLCTSVTMALTMQIE